MLNIMTRQNCVYCNKEITTRSREHVIQNALGGLYESEDICCPECNNYISKCIDAPFTKIFNPIISNIECFSKTNKTKSTPLCTGTVLYNGKEYKANIRGGKVSACPELSKELRTDISKLPLQIISYDFDFQNNAFQNGISKIAFNYALDKGIDLNTIKDGLQIQNNKNSINSITFNYPIIPFYPLNPFDEYIELNTNPSLYHNMILFSQQNTLWCYVDLFNTFQYYVLLSDKFSTRPPVYENYIQTLQKIERTEPEINVFDPKEIMILADQYGVEPTMNPDEFSKRIKIAIAKRSQKTAVKEIIQNKLKGLTYYSFSLKSTESILKMNFSLKLYFDKQEKFNERNFRTITISNDCKQVLSYPYAINSYLKDQPKALLNYTNAKFDRLNYLLCNKTK